ncbi:NAC domain containing protein 4 [Euphorbia peplus]|nr:NAC domain containing protein 4 [Euphorbia peplus]
METAPPPPNPLSQLLGYRFRPDDQELVGNFLRRKNLDPGREDMPIAVVKICDFEPWDLPEKSKLSDEKIWYFFCPRDLKYTGSRRLNRSTKAGVWKPTGKFQEVKGYEPEEGVIGTNRSVVFHKKSSPETDKTEWIIHEYECTQVQGDFVLCKLMVQPNTTIQEAGTGGMSSASSTSHDHEMLKNNYKKIILFGLSLLVITALIMASTARLFSCFPASRQSFRTINLLWVILDPVMNTNTMKVPVWIFKVLDGSDG